MIGRPDPSEAAPYAFRYIDQVPGGDPVAVLRDQLEAWPGRLAAISEERSLFRYAPDKWSIRQVLNHVTDTERAFAFRMLWFARGFDSPLPGIDQETAAAGAQADNFPWSTHLDDFRNVRKSTLSLIANLPESAWKRGGVASDHYVTVRALAFISAGHVAHHARILEERYLS
ncbi:MAG TPA: DinB family protein [Terracidiphilus sp.]|nr:DinB family protein [Terracidiphilus sp.]